MTWEIVLGIIALIGLGVSVATPMIKLNTTITTLTVTVKTLSETIKGQQSRLDQLYVDVLLLKNKEDNTHG